MGFTGMNSGKEAERGVPVLFGKRQNCCGCSACYAICPVGAIKMKQNQAGFLYPVINKQKCIRCYQCLSVCAFKADQAKKGVSGGVGDGRDNGKSVGICGKA